MPNYNDEQSTHSLIRLKLKLKLNLDVPVELEMPGPFLVPSP